ncbi:MAG TPA: adenylosuccinate lyase, partial [Actinomadura sp.]|nr:adenylosuccinate lyase [Actinomadura sp.]
TAARVREKAAGKLDAARILEIEEKTRHDVIAFLTHVEELAGADARWLHLGMTSSDVLDTSLALLLGDATHEILGGLDLLMVALKRRANEHRHTAMIGRSHGIHAEPVTLGIVFAGFYAEARRNRRRLRYAHSSVAVGKIAGAVGTYANVSPAVEKEALSGLGLRPETVATQIVQRDRHAELFNTLALIGSSVEKLAIQIRHWQRTEVGEAEEAFGKGQKGSSAMPHKKNPILSERICGLARIVRGQIVPVMEGIPLWHERDISHSSVERVALPDASITTDYLLHLTTRLVSGLVVDTDRMRANLESTGGLIHTSTVLLELVEAGMSRDDEAYPLVQRAAMETWRTGTPFRETLRRHAADAGRTLDEARLDEVCRPERFVERLGPVFDRLAALR